VIIPPAAYLAHTKSRVVAGVRSVRDGRFLIGHQSCIGARDGWAGRWYCAWGPLSGYRPRRSELAERWAARYESAAFSFRACCPHSSSHRHSRGYFCGWTFAGYALATLAGSLLWCLVLAWLGVTIGRHPELLAGSLHRFFALVLARRSCGGAVLFFSCRKPSAEAHAAYEGRGHRSFARVKYTGKGERRAKILSLSPKAPKQTVSITLNSGSGMPGQKHVASYASIVCRKALVDSEYSVTPQRGAAG